MCRFPIGGRNGAAREDRGRGCARTRTACPRARPGCGPLSHRRPGAPRRVPGPPVQYRVVGAAASPAPIHRGRGARSVARRAVARCTRPCRTVWLSVFDLEPGPRAGQAAVRDHRLRGTCAGFTRGLYGNARPANRAVSRAHVGGRRRLPRGFDPRTRRPGTGRAGRLLWP